MLLALLPALQHTACVASITVTHTIGRIIEAWNLVMGMGGIVYGEFKKQYDGIVD